jgi:hypothetical protein
LEGDRLVAPVELIRLAWGKAQRYECVDRNPWPSSLPVGDLHYEALETELAFLRAEIYQCDADVYLEADDRRAYACRGRLGK